MTQVYEFRHRHALAGTAETDAPSTLRSPLRWPRDHLQADGGAPQGPKRARNALGTGVLVGLLVLALLALRREETPVS